MDTGMGDRMEIDREVLVEAARQLGHAAMFAGEKLDETVVETPAECGQWRVTSARGGEVILPDGDVVIRALILMALRRD